MPLQGHWERQNTPMRRLGRRERVMAFVALGISVVSVLGLVLVTAGDSQPKPKPGCISALVPGVMGSQPVDACGAKAKKVCAAHAIAQDPVARAIRKSCREAGLL